MPIPGPKENESKVDYITRCNSFLHEENKHRDSNRSPEQINAICQSQWGSRSLGSRRVFLGGAFTYKALGNALQIEGELLREGVWVGLDGVPTRYSLDFLKSVEKTIVGRPIIFAHDISPESMDFRIPKGTTVGFWTKGNLQGSTLHAKGYIFYPPAVTYARKHPEIGLSIEADIHTTYNSTLGIEDAKSGMLTGGALIEDPACPTCRVTSAREVNLERGKMMEKDNDKQEFLEFKKEGVEPTRGAFFSWIEGQLKDAKVPEEDSNKLLETLKKSITVPYPYPEPKVQALLEALTGKKLSEYTDFMKTCEEGGKSMEACAEAWKKKNLEGDEKTPPEEPEKPPKELSPELASNPVIKGIVEELATTKAELEAAKKITEMQATEDIDVLTGKIKEYDKDFDAPKFLEGVECKALQKKMLQKYVETLKKHAKPIRLQIGEDGAKATVKKITDEMFGPGATLSSVMEFPTEEK